MRMKQVGMTKQRRQDEPQPDIIVLNGVSYHQIKAFEFPQLHTTCAHCTDDILMDHGPLCWFCDDQQACLLERDCIARPKGRTLGQLVRQAMRDWARNDSCLPSN